ncbi:MAG: glycosyltransferase family 2 protein [Chloroflexi bacterium]|nr:glycosyltransferase family 2 protein [Chloroflexota bacterium]
MTSISAVLPAYNEEAVIANTAASLADALERLTDDYEVIVVNDGSQDRTQQQIDELHGARPRIRCVSHASNRGYGEALRTGLDAGTKELLFITDGDGQFDPAELERFLPPMAGADLVIGYRAPRRDPWIRNLYGFGWNHIVVRTLFGYTARDVDCAFKLIRREVWEHIKVHSGGATFSAELLIRARSCGYRVVELPVRHLPRSAGRATGGNPRVILRAFRDIIRLRLTLRPCPKRAGHEPRRAA